MKSKPLIKRFAPLLIVLAVLVAAVAVATPVIAYYIRTSGEASSPYTPAEPDNPSFVLDNENNEVSGVKIKVPDEGYPVYVRVALVINWKSNEQDTEGDVLFGMPAYEIKLGTNWEQRDDLYYYTVPVESNGTTEVFLESFSLKDDAPEGYVLSVVISVQTVQAIGSTDKGNIPAYEDAWEKFSD